MDREPTQLPAESPHQEAAPSITPVVLNAPADPPPAKVPNHVLQNPPSGVPGPLTNDGTIEPQMSILPLATPVARPHEPPGWLQTPQGMPATLRAIVQPDETAKPTYPVVS